LAEDTTDSPEPLTEWTAILDGIEASIALAFAGEDPEWRAPADPGPIPEELIERALRLLDAQREAELMLAERLVTVGRHLGAVSSIPVAAQAGSGRLDISA
jgi:hypothetical protein